MMNEFTILRFPDDQIDLEAIGDEMYACRCRLDTFFSATLFVNEHREVLSNNTDAGEQIDCISLGECGGTPTAHIVTGRHTIEYGPCLFIDLHAEVDIKKLEKDLFAGKLKRKVLRHPGGLRVWEYNTGKFRVWLRQEKKRL